MTDPIEIDVVGGMCKLVIGPIASCGSDPQSKPGISFALISESRGMLHEGKWYMGMGVIRRDDAKRLRDMLDSMITEAEEISVVSAMIEAPETVIVTREAP